MSNFYSSTNKLAYKFSLLLFVSSLLLFSNSAKAGSVAVFPLLDLTRDANGVNFTLTETIRQKMAEDGFSVIVENEIMDFMVRNRIRSLGTLSSYELTQLRKELGAEYALFGTVCQLEEMPTAKISISLQLVRTSDEQVVWSKISDLHKDDMISLLGLGMPESLTDLYQEYFSTILDEIPKSGDKEDVSSPFVNLIYVDMRPLYVKPGEKIELTARFYSNVKKGNLPSFYLEIDGKKHDVEVDEDAHFIKTSFLAGELSGAHHVSLIARFPSGEQQSLKLGDYTVDAIPPELEITLIGKEIEGSVYFTKELIIASKLVIPEIISMWEVLVYDEAGDVLVSETGGGQLPEKIYWNGKDDNREKVPDGQYRVVVTAWDRAMNKTQSEQLVYYRNVKPEYNFFVNRNGETVIVELESLVGYPLAHWFLKIYRKNGTLVTSQVGGQTLPASLEVKMSGTDAMEGLELILASQDIYGNTSYVTVPNLLNYTQREVLPDVVPESQWLESF